MNREEKQGRLRREEIIVQENLVRCCKGERRCREEKDGAEKTIGQREGDIDAE